MTKIPDSILSVSSLLLHIFLVPVFYLCFVLFYASEWIMEFYDAGLGIVFNTLMTMCILIGVLCLSRIPMTACRHRLTLTWRDYMLWSIAEFIVFSCFAALYMALVRKHYGYFPALSQCLQIATTVLIYPYTVFALLIALVRPDEEKAAESKKTEKNDAKSTQQENKAKTKGEMVAGYALQFVGNPYVYGGCSLTKGTDCSGFVMLIYRHFGVNLPHYDAAIRTKGKSVPSLKEAKAGDIICYYGHVAIYLGDGRIVHASNSRDGIKISERADYRTIAGIRRIFD